MAMATLEEYDYLIAGGGLTGCAGAVLLHRSQPTLKTAILEAGPDEHHNPTVKSPMSGAPLHATSLEWKYETSR